MGKTPRGNRRTSRSPHHADAARSGRPLMRKALPASLWLLGLAAGPFVLGGTALAAPPPVGGIERSATPTGGVVVGGAGSITQNGLQTIIDQTTNKLALDWQTFNVGKDASVLFNQPSASAVALNRILDQSPSQIFGRIDSNGRVFLINTHGIIFGSTAQLNVGSLVASTLDLTPKDFLAGKFDFNLSGARAGIVNHGTIQAASGGSVALLGGSVVNDGLIVANYGSIHLDGADRAVLDFEGNGLLNIQITGELAERLHASEAAVDNKGRLRAEGGTVVLQASAAKDLFTNLVNNSGVVDAGGITTEGGVVRLVATGGDVINSGTINVSGTHGGNAKLLSDRNVGVTGGSIDASGAEGGGDIRVGGGWQGGEGLQTAEAVYVSPDAVLKADATRRGDGGSVVVWGNRVNNFYGTISARGGATGGDGGRVETSAHDGLNAQGRVDASAPAGRAGTWLLDPHDVNIVSGTAGGPLGGAAPDLHFSASADDSQIGAGIIGTALDGGTNVSVFTGTDGTQNGDITVAAPITASGAGSLYLKAAGSIFLDASIAGNGASPLDVYLWANYGGAADATAYDSRADCGACSVVVGHTVDASITTGGGALDIRTGDASHAGGAVGFGSGAQAGAVDTGSGAFTIDANGIAMDSVNYTFAVGDTTLDGGDGSVALGTTSVDGALVVAGNGVTQAGALTVAGTSNFDAGTGSITLTEADNDFGDEVSLAGSEISLFGKSDLEVASLDSGDGENVSLIAGGTLTLPGPIDTAGGDLTLASNGGTLMIADALSGGEVSLSGSDGLTLGDDVTATGTLHLASSAGAIIQSVGTIATDVLTGSSTGATMLSGVNHIAELGDFSTAGIELNNAEALTVSGAVNAGAGDLLLTTTTGALSIDAGGSASGAGVTLTGHDGVSLDGDVTATGNLALASTDAAITQATDSTIVATGATDVDAGIGAINLSGTNNTFGGAVSLNAGDDASIVSSGALELGDSTVDGALDVTAGGNVTQSGALDVGETTTVTVTAPDSDVMLGHADNTLNNVTIGTQGAGTIGDFSLANDSMTPGSLTLAAVTGDLTLNYVNALLTLSATNLTGSLDVGSGVGIVLGGDVTTQGSQDYRGAVVLDNASVTLDSSGANGAIHFHDTVDNADAAVPAALVVKSGSGDVTFDGAVGSVGGTGALGSLTVDGSGDTTFAGAVHAASLATDSGGNTILGADITTSGQQTYGDTLQLDDDVALHGTTVSLAAVSGGGNGLTIGGNAVINGALSALDSLDISGATDLNTAGVTTTGTQNYGGEVTLGQGTTLTGSTVTLGAVTGDDQVLTVSGDAVLNGLLDGLASLDISGTTMLGGNVTTTGAQTYSGAVLLDSSSQSVTLTGSAVTFASTLDNADSGTPQSLTVNQGSGQARFEDKVGSINGALGDLIIGGSGQAQFYQSVAASSLDTAGAALLYDSITTTGAQTYGGQLALAGPVALTSNDGDVHVQGAVVNFDPLTSQALTVDAGTGAVTFDAALGTAGSALGAVVLSGSGATQFAGTVDAASLVTGTGTTTLGGNVTTTGGAQTYGGAVTLGQGLTLAGSTISLGDVTGGNHALAIAGNAVLGGDMTGLGSLGVSGTTALNTSGVTTTGSQTYAGAVTLAAGTTTLQSTGNGNIAFGGTVDGDGTGTSALVVDAGTGAVGFGGAVGNGDKLDALTASAGSIATGELNIGNGGLSLASTGGDITQSAAFRVDGDASFDAGAHAITLTNSGNQFGGAVSLDNSGPHDVAITNGGALELGASTVGGNLAVTAGGAITQSDALDVAGTSTLTVTAPGADIILGDTNNVLADVVVATSGTGTLRDFTLANGSTTLGNLDLQTPIGRNLTLIYPNAALSLSGTTVNGNLDVTAGSGITLMGNVTTGGTQTYNSAVLLGNDVQVSTANQDVTFASTVDNADAIAHELLVNAGTAGVVSFGGTVGGGANGALSALSVDAGTFDAGRLAIGNGGLEIVTHDGGISQTDTFTVAGTSTFDAGSAGAIVLDDDNQFGGNVAAIGTAVTIHAAGDMTIAALANGPDGAVDLSAAGALTLPAGAIDTGTSDLTLASGGVLTMPGALSGHDISLTSGGVLKLDNTVTGSGAVNLESTGGDIEQTATGIITAGSLAGISAGSTTLDQANHVGTLGVFESGGNFSFNNAQTLTVNNTITADGGNGDIALSTTGAGSNLIVATAIQGNQVTLDSGGSITQTSPDGIIQAAVLTGSSVGDTLLAGANQVDALGSFTTGGDFQFTNNQTLAVSGPLSANGGLGTIGLETTGAGSDLVLGADVEANQVTLDAGHDIELAAGTITANDASLTAANDITQTAGVLDVTTLEGTAGHAAVLDGSNRVDTLGDFTAPGFLLVNAQGLQVAGNLDADDVSLTTTAGGLQIDNALSADTIALDSAVDLALSAALDATTVTLRSGGDITQTVAGLITAGTLAGESTGDTTLDQANAVGVLGDFTAANFSLTNAQALAVNGNLAVGGGAGDIRLQTTAGALTVNSNLAGSAIALESAGNLGLTRAVHGDTVELNSGGDITQTAAGVVTAGTLSGHSVGDTVLDQANSVAVLGGFTAANFRLTSNRALSVTGLSTTNDTGDIALRTTAGALTVDTGLNGHDIALTSAGDLTLTKALHGDIVNVKAGGDIGQTAAGIITAGSLGGTSGGDTLLDQANRVGTLGVFESGGNFSFNNAQTLTVNNAITADDGQGDIALSTSGAGSDLIIATAIKGDRVSLGAGRNISQTSAGTITAATLTGSSVGATTLTGANRVGTLGSFSAAGLDLTNAQTLTVGGPVAGGTSTTLTTTAGDLAIDGAVSGTNTSLHAAGAISEGSKGVVTADTLSAVAGGNVGLGGANRVGTLGGSSGGDFRMTNAQALDVGAVTVGNGKALSLTTTAGELSIGNALSAGSISLKSATDLSLDKALQGTTVSLTAGGDIAQGTGGTIDAHTLSGHSAGSTTLAGDNAIDTVGNFSASGFSLTNGNSLVVAGPLAGGATTTLDVNGNLAINGALSGTATSLRSTGAISQGANGSITAATLHGQSGSATTLDGANRIDTLGGFRAVGFNLTNAKSFTVTGPLDGGASVNLKTTTGDIALNGAVNGTATNLESAGAISQGANGNITAATLTGRSAGATSLAGNNHVDTLGAFSADGFSLHNAKALTVAGPLAGGSSVELATSAGGLAIDGALSGGKVTLVSAGAISEGTGGTITAASLSGRAGGPTVLGTSATRIGNKVDTLGNFSSQAGFSMTNGKTLTLTSIDGSAFTVDAGTASVYLGVANGDLLQNGKAWLFDGAGTFASSGHIGLANAPIYVQGVTTQTVSLIGKPPAYFYAVDAGGNLLPLAGGFAVNVPTSSSASQAQNSNGHGDSYIDPSVVTANYRSFGIVPTGILLPADQQGGCDPDNPDPLLCE